MRAKTLKRVARIFYVVGWLMIVAGFIEFGFSWMFGGVIFLFASIVTMALPDTDPEEHDGS